MTNMFDELPWLPLQPAAKYFNQLSRDALNTSAIFLVSGVAGTGKSRMLKELSKDIAKHTHTWAACADLDCSHPELAIVQALGNFDFATPMSTYDKIVYVLKQRQSFGQKTVLFIDHAEKISADLLDILIKVGEYTKLHQYHQFNLSIIFFSDLLDSKHCLARCEIIKSHYELQPLAPSQTKKLAEHAYHYLGKKRDLSAANVAKLHTTSQGNPAQLLSIIQENKDNHHEELVDLINFRYHSNVETKPNQSKPDKNAPLPKNAINEMLGNDPISVASILDKNEQAMQANITRTSRALQDKMRSRQDLIWLSLLCFILIPALLFVSYLYFVPSSTTNETYIHNEVDINAPNQSTHTAFASNQEPDHSNTESERQQNLSSHQNTQQTPTAEQSYNRERITFASLNQDDAVFPDETLKIEQLETPTAIEVPESHEHTANNNTVSPNTTFEQNQRYSSIIMQPASYGFENEYEQYDEDGEDKEDLIKNSDAPTSNTAPIPARQVRTTQPKARSSNSNQAFFIIRLSQASSSEAAKNQIKNIPIPGSAKNGRIKFNNQTYYITYIGPYGTRTQAEAGIQRLPSSLRVLKPSVHHSSELLP